MLLVAWVGIGVAAAVVLLLAAYYASWVLRTQRRTGKAGIVQRSRLTCPKCGGTFDYEFVPGAALTAVRLGSSRYMACPLCHQWSTFAVKRTLEPPLPP